MVVDAQFRRVKVKHPGYVALHHLGQDRLLNVRRAAELVRHGDAEEVMAAMPDTVDTLRPILDAHTLLVAELEASWEACRGVSKWVTQPPLVGGTYAGG